MSGWGSGQGRLDFYPGVSADTADAECQITVPEKNSKKVPQKAAGRRFALCLLLPTKKVV